MAAGASASATKATILGCGNPLLDISAVASEELLAKYELQMGNAILAEDKHVPLYKELVDSFSPSYIAGGATMNSIRVAQWLLQTPGATSYVGCIGSDPFAEQLRQAAQKDGVNPLFAVSDDKATGTCAVLIHDKERSLVANLAAANEYKIEHFRSAEVQAAVASSSIVYSSGFFLTVCPEAMVEAGKHVAAQNGRKLYALNLAAPFLCSVFKEQMHQVLPYADLVVGNESEAAAYADANGFAGASLEEVASRIAALPKASGSRPRTVIITHGKDPSVVCIGGQVMTFPVPLVPAEEIVDVNGAGDAFVGGFLAGVASGLSIERSVAQGNWASGVIIRTSGTDLPAAAPAVELAEPTVAVEGTPFGCPLLPKKSA